MRAPTKHGFDIGVVEDITLSFSVLRTDEGQRIIVAKGSMAQETMIKPELPRDDAHAQR